MDMLVEGSGDVAIVAFTAYGSHGDGFQWRRQLEDVSARKVFLMNPAHTWYLGRMRGIAPDTVDGIADAIRKGIGERPTLTLGSSMGGFGALLYGALVQAKLCYVFGSNVDMRRDFLREIGDGRCPIDYELLCFAV